MCPVCGEGTLDDAWLAKARQEVKRARAAAEEAHSAANALRAGREAVRRIVAPAPPVVLLGPIDGVDPSAAAAAWAAFSAVDDPAAEEQARDRAVMEGLCSASDALIQAVETLRTSAAASLQAQDAAWQPLSDRARNVIRLGSAAELANLRAKAA